MTFLSKLQMEGVQRLVVTAFGVGTFATDAVTQMKRSMKCHVKNPAPDAAPLGTDVNSGAFRTVAIVKY